MDPYLEPHWLDVHTSLVSRGRDALNGRLPDDLIASAEERVAVESAEGDERLFGPDVRVFELPDDEAAAAEVPVPGLPGAGGVQLAPVRLLAQAEPITERFIRVVEAGTERLVTVIEFVSPTNKRGEGLHAFRSKRAEFLTAGVNFVEIDLVRTGDWRVLLWPHRCPARYVTTYRATVRIPSEPAAAYLQPIPLRQRLPEITIPLRRDDPAVRLDLQQLVDEAYDNGRYARRLGYAGPCVPPLGPADAAWADARLQAAGRR